MPLSLPDTSRPAASASATKAMAMPSPSTTKAGTRAPVRCVAAERCSVRQMGQDVDDRPPRLAKHEAPYSPLLVAEGIGDLEPLLHGPGVDRIDVTDLDR